MEVLALRYPKANVSPAFFGESAESMAIKMEYNLHSIEPCDTEECDCLDECADEYRNATDKAGLKWVAESWGGSIIGSVLGYIEMMDANTTPMMLYRTAGNSTLETLMAAARPTLIAKAATFVVMPLAIRIGIAKKREL